MAKKTAKKFFRIYEKLVAHEGDMVGNIAYSLYKAEKVNYIIEYKKRYGVEEVPDSEIEAFTKSRDNPISLKHYREMAIKLLQEFFGDSYEEKLEQFANIVASKVTNHIDKKIVPIIPKKETKFSEFWWNVAASVVASLINPKVIFVLLLLIAFIFGLNVESIMKAIYQVLGIAGQ